jgi:hypothetical protein
MPSIATLAALKRASEFGIGEFRKEMPVPAEPASRETAVPEIGRGGTRSKYQGIILGEGAWTRKAAIAAAGLVDALGEYSEGRERRGAWRFVKMRGAPGGLPGSLPVAPPEEAIGMLRLEPSGPEKREPKYAAHCDGTTVRVFARAGTGWIAHSNMPYSEKMWPVSGKHFAALLANGANVFGAREFFPTLGNMLYIATRHGEYSWEKDGDTDTRAASEAGREIGRAIGLSGRELDKYSALCGMVSAAGRKCAATDGNTTVSGTDYIANIEFLEYRAKRELAAGNSPEALYCLRQILEVAMVQLAGAPMCGTPLKLFEYADGFENIAKREFVCTPQAREYLHALGWRDGVRNTFWNVVGAVGSKAAIPENAFCLSLGLGNSAIFHLDMSRKPMVVSVLEKGSEIKRGHDIIRVRVHEKAVRLERIMAQSSGSGAALAPWISSAFRRMESRGWERYDGAEPECSGRAAYAVEAARGKILVTLLESKRFC